METIQNNFVVEIDYTLTDENGEVLDSSSDRGPLAYIHGLGHLIPGLENEIQGKVVGDSFTATIPPEQAYGVYDENLIYNVPLSDFVPNPEEINVGDVFQVQNNAGEVMAVKVMEIDQENETFKLDGNHPLADKSLTFEVKIVSARMGTEEELEKGHPIMGDSCDKPGCC